ncbi:MAG TPA: hypothetical protein VHZ03_20745 [Trebonia sp.]|jgi:hypothetical protein|nr:hypothetical protein [Trebonia sp.]
MASTPTPVYSKSNPAAGGESMSPRQKRILLIVCAAVAVAAIVGCVWGAFTHDEYATSANGCVNISSAGSTGGGLIHVCGTDAKSFCRTAYQSSTPHSRAVQAQCVDAGWTRAKVAAG